MDDHTKADIIIIGAGLTGLAIAHYLKKQDLKILILESRDRIGGRILTINNEGVTPIEMGATWLSTEHRALQQLLVEIGLETFEQHLGKTAVYEPFSTAPAQLVQLPHSDNPSYRVKGGTDTIIKTLATELSSQSILLNQTINKISLEANKVLVTSQDTTFESSIVISTLPPLLMANTINFATPLPDGLMNLAKSTHTWMGDSIKVALSFKTKFWNAKELSGTIFSNVGPITEMYDHSNVADSQYALKGFFNGAYYHVSRQERLELVLKQLEKYYGAQVRDYLTYEELVWKKETSTATSSGQNILPHQNNGATQYQQSYLDGRFYIAGTETSPINGGYMEGAIQSALFISNQLENRKLNS